jgi:hypothetical protein
MLTYAGSVYLKEDDFDESILIVDIENCPTDEIGGLLEYDESHLKRFGTHGVKNYKDLSKLAKEKS